MAQPEPKSESEIGTGKGVCAWVCIWKYNHEAAACTSMQSPVAFSDGGVRTAKR